MDKENEKMYEGNKTQTQVHHNNQNNYRKYQKGNRRRPGPDQKYSRQNHNLEREQKIQEAAEIAKNAENNQNKDGAARNFNRIDKQTNRQPQPQAVKGDKPSFTIGDKNIEALKSLEVARNGEAAKGEPTHWDRDSKNQKQRNKHVKSVETADDIIKDCKRIEKEIDLEIKEIAALKLGI